MFLNKDELLKEFRDKFCTPCTATNTCGNCLLQSAWAAVEEAAQHRVQADDGYCHCPITKTEAVLAGSLCPRCFRHRR
jgi:hypothetical protein